MLVYLVTAALAATVLSGTAAKEERHNLRATTLDAGSLDELRALVEQQANVIQGLMARLSSQESLLQEASARSWSQQSTIDALTQDTRDLWQRLGQTTDLPGKVSALNTAQLRLHSQVALQGYQLRLQKSLGKQNGEQVVQLQSLVRNVTGRVELLEVTTRQPSPAVKELAVEVRKQGNRTQLLESGAERQRLTVEELGHAMQRQQSGQQRVESALEERAGDLEHLQNHVERLGNESLLLQSAGQQRNATLTLLGDGVRTLQQRQRSMDSQISKQGRSAAFYAAMDHKSQDFTVEPHSSVPFNSTDLNVGGAFNQTSGVFTAPFPGLYYFSLGCMRGHQNASLQLGIYANGHRICSSLAKKGKPNANDQGFCSVMTRLKSGARVDVRALDKSVVWSSGFSFFLGTLLHSD